MFQRVENEMKMKEQQLQELDGHVSHLKQLEPEREEEIERRRTIVAERYGLFRVKRTGYKSGEVQQSVVADCRWIGDHIRIG